MGAQFQNYYKYPKVIWRKKRAKEIEAKIKELFQKETLNLIDLSTSRILITEYKVLMDWEGQKEVRQMYRVQ